MLIASQARTMKVKSVLVVDDEIEILEIWMEVIANLGHTVYTARNGDAAVDIIKEIDLDLIITDMQMPGSDGMTILKYLVTLEERPKIIISSGHIQDSNLMVDYKVEKLIRKPFDLVVEMKYINSLLSEE